MLVSIINYEQGLTAPGTNDGSRCFKIVDHKTDTTQGMANIAVDSEEAGLLANYMSKRNKLNVEHHMYL